MLVWRFHSILLSPLFAVALSLSVTNAWADGETQGAAESLFIEGRRLMDEEQYMAACQKFADSQRLDPAVGTALNLARCYAKLGRSASAWRLFREAAALANAAQQSKREEAALTAAAALEASLPRVVLTRDRNGIEDEVRLDGAPVPTSLFDVPMPLDPGQHVVSVERAGHVLWRSELEAKAGQIVNLTVPTFAPPPLSSLHAPTLRGRPRDTGGPSPTPARRAPGLLRPTAFALAGASLAAVAYASYAAIRAQVEYDRSEAGCNARGECDPTGLAARDRAFDQARGADIALAFAGGAAIGAGVLWFSANHAEKASGTGPMRSAWCASWQGTW